MNSNEIIKESGISVLKALIGEIPIAGTALNEAIFECRSRVKQNRINNFISELGKYIESTIVDVDLAYIKGEQFGDILESIFSRVINAGTQHKIERFKMILVKQMNPSNYIG